MVKLRSFYSEAYGVYGEEQIDGRWLLLSESHSHFVNLSAGDCFVYRKLIGAL